MGGSLSISPNFDAFGNVGADDDCIGGRHRVAPAREIGEVVVVGEAAEAGVGEVAVRAGVPRDGALEEGDVMATGGEGGEERAVGGGVAVAPGRAEAEAEDDEPHARLRSRLAAAVSFSSRSTVSARSA